MLTIGVDVGGTGIKSALIKVGDVKCADTYEIVDFSAMPTQASEGSEVVVRNIIKSIERYDWQKCELIAVASAGTIDWDNGTVTFATATIPGYAGTELSHILTEYFGRRVVVINDAVGALIGECFLGAGKKAESVMMFTIGTGLGGSFLAEKTLDANSVIDTKSGHMTLHEGGRECTCGKTGCAEQYVSATALKRYGNDNLYQLFRSSDAAEKKVKAEFFKDLTRVICESAGQYRPDLVVIGGGVIELSEYWWQNFLKEYKRICDVPIASASLGNKAGVLGSVYAMANGAFKNQ